MRRISDSRGRNGTTRSPYALIASDTVIRRLLPLLAFLLLFGPALGPADAADPPPSPAAVDRAIEQGVEWLLEEQRPDGTWGSGSRAFGHTVLAAYALLHSGVELETKGFAKAIRWLDRHGPGLKRTLDKDADTYATSLLVLLLRDRGLALEPRMKRAVPGQAVSPRITISMPMSASKTPTSISIR